MWSWWTREDFLFLIPRNKPQLLLFAQAEPWFHFVPVKPAVMAAGTGMQEQRILPVTAHQEPRAHPRILNKSKKELAELLKLKKTPVISHYSQQHTGKQPMFSKYYQEPRNVRISKIGKSDKTGPTGNQLSQDKVLGKNGENEAMIQLGI